MAKQYEGARSDEELLDAMACSVPGDVEGALHELAGWFAAADGGKGFVRYVRIGKLVKKKKAYAPAIPRLAKLIMPELAYWWAWALLEPFAPLVAAYGEDATITRALANIGDVRNGAAEVLARRFAEHPEEAVARATRIADLLLTEEHSLSRARGAGIFVLPTIADAHDELPAKYDALVKIDHERPHEAAALRRVLVKVPHERRSAIFAVPFSNPTLRYIVVELLDLAPEIAVRFLEYFKGYGKLGAALAEPGLAKWRAELPRVAEICEQYEVVARAEKPPEPPAPRVPGPYSFVKPKAIYPSDYAKLDAVSKAQYRQAAGAYVGGGPVKNPRNFIARLKKDGLDEGDAQLRRWKILRDGKHVFDLWVVWVENGTFFVAGSEEPAEVQIIQGKFEAYGKTPPVVAEELAASEPEGGLWKL